MSDVSLLVASCDKYGDLWRPFFEVFFARWPDCPHPVYLGCNHGRFEHPRVAVLRAGDDTTWTGGLRRMLERIDSPQVLLLLEDFLLTRPVDTPAVDRLAGIARENHLACLRLRCATPPSRRLPAYGDLGVLRRGDSYRVSAQAALWDAAKLRALLRLEFSAWQFEELGTHVANRLPWEFWGVYRTVIHYLHGVERGRWRLEGLEICRQLGVEVDLAARPAMTPEQLRAYSRQGRRNRLIRAMTPRWLLRLVRLHRRRPDIDRYLAQIQDAPAEG